MKPTVHQRVHLWLWHWRTGPVDEPELRTLYADGARVLRVQLQDDGELPRERVDLWKSLGYRVWGAVRPSGEPLRSPGARWEPQEVASFARTEKQRLGLQGLEFNFEREVRLADIDSSGAWSEAFAASFRGLCPTLPCALDTVYGEAAGGINLGAYVTRGFRLNVQTYWGNEGIYDDPVPRIGDWCKGASPSIAKTIVKPLIRVSRNNAGELPDQAQVLADCVEAGTKGLTFYYIDGAGFPYLRDFVTNAIALGAAA